MYHLEDLLGMLLLGVFIGLILAGITFAILNYQWEKEQLREKRIQEEVELRVKAEREKAESWPKVEAK